MFGVFHAQSGRKESALVRLLLSKRRFQFQLSGVDQAITMFARAL